VGSKSFPADELVRSDGLFLPPSDIALSECIDQGPEIKISFDEITELQTVGYVPT